MPYFLTQGQHIDSYDQRPFIEMYIHLIMLKNKNITHVDS